MRILQVHDKSPQHAIGESAHRIAQFAPGLALPCFTVFFPRNDEIFAEEQEVGFVYQVLSGAVRDVFDLRPAAISRDLDLRRPIYKKTAAYGHFGRSEKEFTWEATPRVDDLRSALGL